MTEDGSTDHKQITDHKPRKKSKKKEKKRQKPIKTKKDLNWINGGSISWCSWEMKHTARKLLSDVYWYLYRFFFVFTRRHLSSHWGWLVLESCISLLLAGTLSHWGFFSFYSELFRWTVFAYAFIIHHVWQEFPC